MTRLQLVAADAAADVALILSTWLVAQLARDGANLYSLSSEPALRALVISIALWLGLWAARYLRTNDPIPPEPSTPQPPGTPTA